MKTDLIIIGGGASGLVAGITAARAGISVTILEHKESIGKKILATGNGKCNYTNLVQSEDCYNSENIDFVREVLSLFSEKDTIRFFRGLGIYPKDKNGYLYPYSEQAAAVVDVLRMELAHLKVKVKCKEHVKEVLKDKNEFVIKTETYEYRSDMVILATGGFAGEHLGADGSGYKIVKRLGHNIVPTVPALVQLKAKNSCFNSLAGIRVMAKVMLCGHTDIWAEGEVQLTNYGISGIPVFQISRHAAKELENRKPTYVEIDFFPILPQEELKKLLMERLLSCPYKSLEEGMVGLLNPKLGAVLIRESGLNPKNLCSNISDMDIDKLMRSLKEFCVEIIDTKGFSNAQVTAGGVDTSEINASTMESHIMKNLYITGELLDVDGICGGYNLQWAWSTGYLAGKAAAEHRKAE